MVALTAGGQLVFGSSSRFLTEGGEPVFQIAFGTTGTTDNGAFVFDLTPAGIGGSLISMAHFWMGGVSGPLSPATDAAYASMAHFWMGGAQGGTGRIPPGGGFLEPPYFIVNMGRMMSRRGG